MEDLSDGKFSFVAVYDYMYLTVYVQYGRYLSGYSKKDKHVLRKQETKF